MQVSLSRDGVADAFKCRYARAKVRVAHRLEPWPPTRSAGAVTDAYVCRLLPLTCLAPDIVEAILDGRQPKRL